MNRKKIRKVLKEKHDDFIRSIKDENVKNLVKKNSMITGGSIASMLLGEPIKDFDYYFLNIDTVIAVAHYYVDEFIRLNPDSKAQPSVSIDGERVKILIPSSGVAGDPIDEDEDEEEEVEKEKYSPVFLSANAITLSNKVQLVIRFYGTPKEVHENYDFVHCTNYWLSHKEELVLHPFALESLLSKNLYYQGSLYPICSIIRTRKFLKRGWHINAGQYLKMCFQVSELDLTDVEVLEEQLTGVDALYFFQLIAYCRERQEKDSTFQITTPYLSSVVDKIFS